MRRDRKRFRDNLKHIIPSSLLILTTAAPSGAIIDKRSIAWYLAKQRQARQSLIARPAPNHKNSSTNAHYELYQNKKYAGKIWANCQKGMGNLTIQISETKTRQRSEILDKRTSYNQIDTFIIDENMKQATITPLTSSTREIKETDLINLICTPDGSFRSNSIIETLNFNHLDPRIN